jgi:hypothetical protein
MAMTGMYPPGGLSGINTQQYEQIMLQGVVNKRISIFQYIKRAYFFIDPCSHSHETGEYWCDTVFCSKEDLERIYSDQKGIGKRFSFTCRS